jgi:hypothetical protein
MLKLIIILDSKYEIITSDVFFEESNQTIIDGVWNT